MDASTFADYCATLVLKSGCPPSMEEFRQMYIPIALGFDNNGFIAPYELFFKPDFARQLFRKYATSDLSGMVKWLRVFSHLQRKGCDLLRLHSPEELEQYLQMDANVSTWMVPLFEVRDGFTHREFLYRQTSYLEIMNYMGFDHFSDFAVYLIELLLFGFPVYRTYLESFGLNTSESFSAYVRSRLTHGALDRLFSTSKLKNEGYVSAFLENVPTDEKDFRLAATLKRAYLHRNNAQQLEAILKDVEIVSQNVQFLGANSELLQTLQRQNLLPIKDQEYADYITNSKISMNRMGQRLFENVRTGKYTPSESFGKGITSVRGGKSTGVDMNWRKENERLETQLEKELIQERQRELQFERKMDEDRFKQHQQQLAK